MDYNFGEKFYPFSGTLYDVGIELIVFMLVNKNAFNENGVLKFHAGEPLMIVEPYNINDYQFIQSWLERVLNMKQINILVFKTFEDYKDQINQRYKKHGIHIPLNYLLECYDYCDQNKDYYDQIVYDIDDLKFL